MSILSPTFLANNIDVIALILGATLIVIFSDTVNKHLVFPIADRVKHKAKGSLTNMSGSSQRAKRFSGYGSDALAAGIFVAYCYLGAFVVAEYLFEPILVRMRGFILLVVLFLFLIVSIVINDKHIRKRLMNH